VRKSERRVRKQGGRERRVEGGKTAEMRSRIVLSATSSDFSVWKRGRPVLGGIFTDSRVFLSPCLPEWP